MSSSLGLVDFAVRLVDLWENICKSSVREIFFLGGGRGEGHGRLMRMSFRLVNHSSRLPKGKPENIFSLDSGLAVVTT